MCERTARPRRLASRVSRSRLALSGCVTDTPDPARRSLSARSLCARAAPCAELVALLGLGHRQRAQSPQAEDAAADPAETVLAQSAAVDTEPAQSEENGAGPRRTRRASKRMRLSAPDSVPAAEAQHTSLGGAGSRVRNSRHAAACSSRPQTRGIPARTHVLRTLNPNGGCAGGSIRVVRRAHDNPIRSHPGAPAPPRTPGADVRLTRCSSISSPLPVRRAARVGLSSVPPSSVGCVPVLRLGCASADFRAAQVCRTSITAFCAARLGLVLYSARRRRLRRLALRTRTLLQLAPGQV